MNMNIVSYKHKYKHTYNTYMQKYKINPLSHTYIYTYIHAFTKRDLYVFILASPWGADTALLVNKCNMWSYTHTYIHALQACVCTSYIRKYNLILRILTYIPVCIHILTSDSLIAEHLSGNSRSVFVNQQGNLNLNMIRYH